MTELVNEAVFPVQAINIELVLIMQTHMQELMAVAIDGTKNVINAAADMGVQRVVFTSSYGAVHMNPNRNPDQVVDESCWSDLEFCLETKVKML